MSQRVLATYRNGTFELETPCDLPEETQVELTIDVCPAIPPRVTDPVERRRLMRELTMRMMQNPIPANAPKFTRDELHERR